MVQGRGWRTQERRSKLQERIEGDRRWRTGST